MEQLSERANGDPPSPAGVGLGERELTHVLEGMRRIERAVQSGLQDVADYLTPFRAGFVRRGTTTTVAYPSTHPDEGYADADTFVVPVLTRRVDLVVTGTRSLIAEWDDQGSQWEGDAEYPAGYYPLPLSIRRFRVKSSDATAVQQAAYCVVFWC